MQAGTGTLVAAIQSKEQTPAASIKADWLGDGSFFFDPGIAFDIASDTVVGLGDLGDLSPFVESWSVGRSLSTDLPEAAKVVEGFSAAEASVTLAGSIAGYDLVELLAPYDNTLSPFAPRIGAPVTVDAGFRSSAGTELLRQITGRVRNVAVDPDSGTVTLSVLDRRESVRTPVTLPVVVADDWGTVRPGLWAQWVMDYIARANGFYASPPVRAQCFLSATLHGSAWPEVGTLTTAQLKLAGAARGQVAYGPFTDGMMGMRPVAGAIPDITYTVPAGLTTNTGATLFVQARVKSTTSTGVVIADIHAPAPTSGRAIVQALNGSIRVDLTRGGVSVFGSVSLASLTFPGEHTVGIQITFGGVPDAVMQASCEGVTGSGVLTGAGTPTGGADMTIVAVGTNNPDATVASLQVTNEPYAAGMFPDAFVPSAVFEQSFNNLTATPPVDTSDPWELLQQLAAAEQGTLGFDENGVLRFNNRAHMTGGAAVATVTTDPAVGFANMLKRASTEAIDAVRNYVTVPAQPYTVDPPGTAIWVGTEVLGVLALSSLVVPVEFEGVVYALASVSYLAAKNADGTGGDVANLTITAVKVTPTTYTLTVANPNAFDVFLVTNSTVSATQGDPRLTVVGQLVRAADTYNSIRQDTGSQARYGRQSLDVPGSVWMQSMAAADALSTALLGMLAAPSPTLDGVEIVADPRLQLGDRVRVVDQDGLALDHDFFAVGVSSQGSTGGYTQSLVMRQA
jgi:hypothetical protein